MQQSPCLKEEELHCCCVKELLEAVCLIGPGEITVLSNLQEGCVTRNPSTCLCERLKVALTSEAGLGGSVVVQVWGSICPTSCAAQLNVAQRGPLRPPCVLAFTLQPACIRRREAVCSFIVTRMCSWGSSCSFSVKLGFSQLSHSGCFSISCPQAVPQLAAVLLHQLGADCQPHSLSPQW